MPRGKTKDEEEKLIAEAANDSQIHQSKPVHFDHGIRWKDFKP